jgi:hypothetical protein
MTFADSAKHIAAKLRGRKGLFFGAVLFFAFFTAFTLRFSLAIPRDNGHLRSDAAGYYIYLPGLFHYGFDGSTIDSMAIEVTGRGFSIDSASQKIVTKYTYGTALLELPFYVVAEIITGFESVDGRTRDHFNAIAIAGIFYWTLGLLHIALALQRIWPTDRVVVICVLGCIAFGTNTFFYAFRAPAYSHVYSFFLVSLAMFAASRATPVGWSSLMRWVFVAANALMVVIRPVDAIAVLALAGFLWVRNGRGPFTIGLILRQLLALVVFTAPQLLYWHHVHGQWIVWSYGNEGFTQWADPEWSKVLAAPMNGLLPNAPLFALVPFALWSLWYRSRGMSLWLAATLLTIIYSCAAWHVWHFGCSYGLRPLVQYTPFLAVGLWAMFAQMRERFPALFNATMVFLALVCFVNYRVMLYVSHCFNGEHWGWGLFFNNILEALGVGAGHAGPHY